MRGESHYRAKLTEAYEHKRIESAEIQKQVDEYLAKGGKIEQVDHTANHSFEQPIKRKKRAQIDYMKRFGTTRRRG